MAPDASGSSSASPDAARSAAAAGRVASRFITGLTAWWLAFPVALWIGSALIGDNVYDETFWDRVGRMLMWVGVGGALLSPIAGTAVALFGRQRRACVRFAMMGALSYGVFLWLLYALLTAD
ncbi:hypothetical protein GCM10009527_077720 [Actinomadura nitritigenes]|uniref:Uncharacterized protein n=1 Tax=Actinomadura nitritigenes TaxID=134602 RepID=A0ABS3R2Q1_9ACTN|nr:hypothetical protein [Actinomadura nitritigenes]MBO2440524.1 hypothetical protein [Actinomadura nitritigenes]